MTRKLVFSFKLDQNIIRVNRLFLFICSLGNVLPRRAQRKKLFRACCLWQGCTIPHVYKGRYKAQTAVVKETLSRTPAAARAVSTRLGSCIAMINQWNVVRNIRYPSVTHDPQFNSCIIPVEFRDYE